MEEGLELSWWVHGVPSEASIPHGIKALGSSLRVMGSRHGSLLLDSGQLLAGRPS